MYDIYSHAAAVLACIGDSDSSSESIFSLCNAINGIVERNPSLLTIGDQDRAERLLRGLLERTHGTRARFLSHLQHCLVELGRRPYWVRLWILQEIVAAEERMWILCGDSETLHQDLYTINKMLALAGETWDWYLSAHMVAQAQFKMFHPAKVRIKDVIRFLDTTECYDPRDRIFGITAMIDWEQDGMCPLLPDYSKSAWSLAETLIEGLPHLGALYYYFILEVLRVDASTPERCELVRDRISPQSSACQTPRNCRFLLTGMIAMRLREGAGNALQCAQGGWKIEESAISNLLAPLELLHLQEYNWCNGDDRSPKKVLWQDHPIALVCGTARPNDILLVMAREEGFMDKKCLVLRPGNNTTLDVIGTGIAEGRLDHEQCLLLRSMSRKADTLPSCDLFSCDLLLSATSQDVMFFLSGFASNMSEMYEGKEDPREWLQFLMTRPIDAPVSAARLVPTDKRIYYQQFQPS